MLVDRYNKFGYNGPNYRCTLRWSKKEKGLVHTNR